MDDNLIGAIAFLFLLVFGLVVDRLSKIYHKQKLRGDALQRRYGAIVEVDRAIEKESEHWKKSFASVNMS